MPTLYTDVYQDTPSGSRSSYRLGLGDYIPGGPSGGAIASEGVLGLRQTLLTLNGAVITVNDNGANGGNAPLKIYTFPPGVIFIAGATASVAIVGGAGLTATSAVVSAVGTAAAGITNATLTLTEADIIPSTVTTLTANAATFTGKSTATQMAAGVWDGTATPIDVYLNFATPDAGITAATTITATGVIRITWVNLGDV